MLEEILGKTKSIIGSGLIHTEIRTETVLKNQGRAGLWLVHAWFKHFGSKKV